MLNLQEYRIAYIVPREKEDSSSKYLAYTSYCMNYCTLQKKVLLSWIKTVFEHPYIMIFFTKQQGCGTDDLIFDMSPYRYC